MCLDLKKGTKLSWITSIRAFPKATNAAKGLLLNWPMQHQQLVLHLHCTGGLFLKGVSHRPHLALKPKPELES